MGWSDLFASVGRAISSGVGSFGQGAVDFVGGVSDVVTGLSGSIGEIFQTASPYIELGTSIFGGNDGGGRSEAQPTFIGGYDSPMGQFGGLQPAPSPAFFPPAGAPPTFGAQQFLPGRTFPTPGDIQGGGDMAIGSILPTLARVGGALARTGPAMLGGAVLGEVLESAVSPQQQQAAGGLMSPFKATARGASAQTFVTSNPVTGATTWFKPAGRPILWSGDLSSCKRVTKIARRARRGR